MNCVFYNARSIQYKHEEIDLFTKEKEIDLAIIAETRITRDKNSPFKNTIVNIPASRHSGGLLAFSHCHYELCIL